MTLYLDLIIVENFLMNFLVLYTTGKILCRKLHIWKIAIASIIGVMYTFSLYINIPAIILNISKVVVASLLVKISFNSSGIKRLLKETALFLVISFIYAGCSLAFVYFCKPKVLYVVNGVIIGGGFIFEIVIFSAIVSLLLIKLCARLIKMKSRLTAKDMITNCRVYNNGHYAEMNALLDSGNLLCDPISKDPVIIVNYEKVSHLFYDEKSDVGCRLIPYSSLGNNDGLLAVRRVQSVEIDYDDETKKICNVLLGFSKEKLSKDGQYDALIGLKVIERGNFDDKSSADVKSKSECGVC